MVSCFSQLRTRRLVKVPCMAIITQALSLSSKALRASSSASLTWAIVVAPEISNCAARLVKLATVANARRASSEYSQVVPSACAS